MDKSQIKKILIVTPNWIGDAVLSVPALSHVRECFPSAYIVLIGLPHISELFQECPYLDEVKVYAISRQKGKDKRQKVDENGSDARNLGGLLTTVRDIRECGFDMAILFPNSFRSALIARLAGIPLRCGYNRDGRGFLLNIPISLNPQVKRLHQAKYYINLVKSIESYFSPKLIAGQKNPSYPSQDRRGFLTPPYLYISKDEANQALETLYKNNLTPDDLIVGINPGAAYGSSKRWYPERFGHVAKNLIERYDAKVIFFGDQREKDIATEIVKDSGITPLNMTGKTTIRELMALIAHCRVFITNDSGPMHIAAALCVPVVAIFGSTDPLLTGPLGDRHMIIKKDVSCSPCFLRKCQTDLKCMDLIGVNDVLEAVDKILG